MDMDDLLQRLSPEERAALREKLAEEDGKARDDLDARLQRLERALFGDGGRDGGGFDPFTMMKGFMGGFGPPGMKGGKRAPQPARVFAALADETRLSIVRLLQEGPKHVDELVRALALAQSTVSHHLKVLKDAGLVQSERHGRQVQYALSEALKDA